MTRRPQALRGAAALLLAVAAVVGADQLLAPQAPTAPGLAAAETRPLTSATLVCPDVDEKAAGTRLSRLSFASEQAGGTVTAHWLAGTPEASYTGSDQPQRLPDQTCTWPRPFSWRLASGRWSLP